MARTRKTWRQKLAEAKAKPGLPKVWYCSKARKRLVVPAPAEVEAIVRRVPRGRLITVQQVGETLRRRHRVDLACPMTTGIFLWLIAHATEEAAAGGAGATPWWRVLKTGGAINPRYPGGGATQRARLEAEGHRITRRGAKLVVADHEMALAGRRPGPPSPSGPQPRGPLRRKVLRHEAFGLCICLPKTEWARLPARGRATVAVNGAAQRATVRRERCNCRGTGWHEHRFLVLPRSAGATPGQVITLGLGQA